MKKVFLSTAGLILTLVLASIFIQGVKAHGQPVIVVNPQVVAAGAQISVTGSEMEADEIFSITLEGMAGTTKLGEATAVKAADQDDGGFEVTFTIPQDTPPGPYTVKASTDDGGAAMADLTVTESSSQSSDSSGTMHEPSSAPHVLERPRSVPEVITIGIFAFTSFLLGMVLIRPRN